MPVAVVIAGARRIGNAIVRDLARSGYSIGLTYHRSHEQAQEICDQIRAAGGVCHFERCDVTDPSRIEDVMRGFHAQLGPADVVICNVGVFPQAQHPSTVTENDLIEAFRINTLPILSLARTYEALCAADHRVGRIVVLGSLGAREIWKDRAAYNTSKAAQQTLVLSLARSYAPRLSINIVAPGLIEQPDEPQDSDHVNVSVRRIPMGRSGTAADVVDAVRYFAGCSHYITGQVIVVDGGYGLVR